MAFTREEMAAYEKRPQTQIDDKVSPFRGATPAKAADAAAIAAVASGQVDATPADGSTAAAAAVTADDSPVVDEDGTIGDPTDSGEGTSDENADSSTASVDSGDDADPNVDLTGGDADEVSAAKPAPKKGSAQERIVELNDLLEGTKVFGNYWKEQALETQAELVRVRGGTTVPGAAPTKPPVDELKDEPMPEMSDPDINFDNDKYRAKLKKWSRDQGRIAARQELQAVTGANAAKTLEAELDQKIAVFSQAHPDFEKVVTKNPVLNANQLAPGAGLEVMRSEHAADLLYAFGNDPAMAIRVARQSPTEQLKTIGKMEAKIEAEKAAAKTAKPPKKDGSTQQSGAQPGKGKSITQAPPPPRATPAAGRTEARSVIDPNLSMEEFARRHREERQAGRTAARKARGLS